MTPDIDPQGLAGEVAELRDRVSALEDQVSAIQRWGLEAAAQLSRDVAAGRETERRARWLRTLRR